MNTHLTHYMSALLCNSKRVSGNTININMAEKCLNEISVDLEKKIYIFML